MHAQAVEEDAGVISPGSLVVVRDETWLVTSVEDTPDGPLYAVRGVSDFVKDTTASFYRSLDDISVLAPEDSTVVADTSPRYRRTRLWIESTLRKTPVPVDHPDLTVSTQMLADDLPYQREAVEMALDPERIRPRLLIADAVGLGKTLEIGMILSELIRRGRGRRILIVCPRHVLEQMQHELWTRFAIPFVRLDSEGVQQVKQQLPASRNPFTFFEKVIISIDTLKQDRFVHDLRHHRWDAVVIDESHNVTNQSTQNNQLAHVLAPNTDALILASATPHNGSNDSFAQLISLLEPTAVSPKREIAEDATQRLMIRRHRYSDSVKDEVGENWAERRPPEMLPVEPSPEELAVAHEIASTWTHPPAGHGPMSGRGSQLFPWTLAKAFLSSPVALRETLRNRAREILGKADAGTLAEIPPSSAFAAEAAALDRLGALNEACLPADGTPRSGKYQRLVQLLRDKGVARTSPERVVVFAERVATLSWLREHLLEDLKLKDDQIAVLHGGLTDVEQQRIVESFKQSSSAIRILITGDIASEGVNLHAQCHELVHFDVPWSLIRIEQRNGRIDRYGQRTPPQITALLLDLSEVDGFDGDIYVLRRLLEREKEAHEQLGDAASLMQKYDAGAEERALIDVLRSEKDVEDVLPEVAQIDPMSAFLQGLLAQDSAPTRRRDGHRAAQETSFATGLFTSDADFLLSGLTELHTEPGRPIASGGVDLVLDRSTGLIQFTPGENLGRRLDHLPQSYLKDRRVKETLHLTSRADVAAKRLRAALDDDTGTNWPDVHYLGPLHPVLDWMSDRVLGGVPSGEVFAIHGKVDQPWVIFQGTLTTARGQIVSSTVLGIANDHGTLRALPHTAPSSLFQEIGLDPDAIGTAVEDPAQYQALLRQAVPVAREFMEQRIAPGITAAAEARVQHWQEEQQRWEADAAHTRGQSALLLATRDALAVEKKLVTDMLPDRTFARPLLVVVPRPQA
ncbi:DEAD/DEAH box helicase [Brachybacterium aquaticum]|uniref:Superfamily II DNA or RNA helicase n=1 Tax=Brachybacterium aquaticum TaxID=1432564 RepID=A0A841AHJ7_9MICO|nr:DEAD/DEAH box helicase [Brachybacterium aquaticum]MBB5832518.1 superfamily II DNA or RNA helicase [Brachybacterium aquaticum]